MKPMRAVVWVALALAFALSLGGCAGDGGETEGAPREGSTATTTDTTSSVESKSSTDPTGRSSSVVASGIVEPDANYPWVVHMNGCGGVLIDPQWVLTAAHCVTPNIGVSKITYKRTDPQTGAESSETISFSRYVGPANNRGVFIHPGYDPGDDYANDIALMKLERPFEIQPMLQTVGLPKVPLVSGVLGNLANFAHNSTLPSGQVAVFRARTPADSPSTYFTIRATAASAFLCPGDSGSGFVTVEDGRATVRGLASKGTYSDCMSFDDLDEADFTDVFEFRGWILDTMGKNDAELTGNTRVRWNGQAAYGRMAVSCPASRSQSGPLNVVGVEEGITCSAGQGQTVSCAVGADQVTGPIRPVLSGITVRTVMEDGTATVRTHKARVNSLRLHKTFPSGAVSGEYTCEIGTRRGGRVADTPTVSGRR